MKRGVRALLKNTAPGKFVRGKYAGYRVKSATGRGTGVKLRGITKLLSTKLFSKGELQFGASGWRGDAWKGEKGGLLLCLRVREQADEQTDKQTEAQTAGQGEGEGEGQGTGEAEAEAEAEECTALSSMRMQMLMQVRMTRQTQMQMQQEQQDKGGYCQPTRSCSSQPITRPRALRSSAVSASSGRIR